MKRSNKYPPFGKPWCKMRKAGTQIRKKYEAGQPFKGRGRFCFPCWLRYETETCPECGR